MAAQRGRTFDGHAGERTRTSKEPKPQRDLNPSRLPVPPRPRCAKDRSGAEAGSARLRHAHGLAKDRAEQAVPEMTEREQEQRDRESRESSETKYEEAAERESEERAREADDLRDLPHPREENDGD
jgi:hypothetical protein